MEPLLICPKAVEEVDAAFLIVRALQIILYLPAAGAALTVIVVLLKGIVSAGSKTVPIRQAEAKTAVIIFFEVFI